MGMQDMDMARMRLSESREYGLRTQSDQWMKDGGNRPVRRNHSSARTRAVNVLAVVLFLLAIASPVSAQLQGPTTGGCYNNMYHAASDCDRLASGSITTGAASTTGNCYTIMKHAASDCDRLASEVVAGAAVIPSTGSANAPTLRDCYSARFHSATDCDRLASGN